MSWESIIDQMKEWVIAQGYLTAGYVNRGYTGVWDFRKTDFIIDGAFHEFDLSAIVPEGVSSVLFVVKLRTPEVPYDIRLRYPGNTHQRNICARYTILANVDFWSDMQVSVDEDRKCEYYFHDTVYTFADLVIRGWWY